MAVAAEAADEARLDAIGLWDHYHAFAPELGVSGGRPTARSPPGRAGSASSQWSSTASTHELWILAKESSTLSDASGGRFELGIGAGDWEDSLDAWGRPFPPSRERIDLVTELVAALRLVWSGEPVTVDFTEIRLGDALSAPAPVVEPRVLVGAGASRRLAEVAAGIADEINIYHDEATVRFALDAAGRSGRPVTVSVLLSWEWDKWPDAPAERIAASAPWVSRECP